MGNTNDQHDEFIVPNFVEYAIVADAKPPQASQVALQGRAEIWGLREPVDGRNNPGPLRSGHTPQLPGCAPPPP